MERRQPSDKGMTHYGVLDTWIANAEREHDERRGAARDDSQGRPAATRAYSPNPGRPYPTGPQRTAVPARAPVQLPPLTPDDGEATDADDDIPF
jgi:hypothetical protein